MMTMTKSEKEQALGLVERATELMFKQQGMGNIFFKVFLSYIQKTSPSSLGDKLSKIDANYPLDDARKQMMFKHILEFMIENVDEKELGALEKYMSAVNKIDVFETKYNGTYEETLKKKQEQSIEEWKDALLWEEQLTLIDSL